MRSDLWHVTSWKVSWASSDDRLTSKEKDYAPTIKSSTIMVKVRMYSCTVLRTFFALKMTEIYSWTIAVFNATEFYSSIEANCETFTGESSKPMPINNSLLLKQIKIFICLCFTINWFCLIEIKMPNSVFSLLCCSFLFKYLDIEDHACTL